MNDLYGQLVDQCIAALEKAGLPHGSVKRADFTIPPDATMGDLALPSFSLAKVVMKNPTSFAKELVEKLNSPGTFATWSAAGPYLNITFDREHLSAAVLTAVETQAEAYGATETGQNDVVVLEYVSANTNKPFHIGHIRNGLVGSSVAELLRWTGCEVIKTDIISDRGIHIMKSMLAYQKWGKGETPSMTKEKPDHFVGRYYVLFDQALQKEKKEWLAAQKIDLTALSEREQEATDATFRAASLLMREAQALLQQWEAGDQHVRQLWNTMNQWTYAGWKESYAILGFTFDHHEYESAIYEKGRAIIDHAIADGIFERSKNGAVIAPLSKSTDLPDKVVLRADGTSLYITQDLYLANKRLDEFGFTKSLYVVANEQALYFQQLFAILKLLKFPAADKLYHLSYGYVSLPEGRMKSREGTVVDADDLITDMEQLAEKELVQRYPDLSAEERADRAKVIALGALKFHFLSVGRASDMVFDPKASLSFEGRTGPYVQYAYARAASIVRKAAEQKKASIPDESAIVTPQHPLEWSLVLAVARFPLEIVHAAEQYDPSKLANFLADLAQHFSTFYHEVPVLSEKDQAKLYTRLRIVTAVKTVLHNGLGMLGIETLEEM